MLVIDKTTLSIDISTSTIGYCFFDSEGMLQEMNFVTFLSNTKQTLYEKADIFISTIAHLKSANIKHIAIEEPLKKFKGKFSNADTIALLNQFNGIISDRCYREFGVEPIHYNVNHARAMVFDGLPKLSGDSDNTKQEIWNRVCKMEPQINWRYGKKSRKLLTENYDMCDAYVAGMCHIAHIVEQEDTIREQNA